MRMVHKYEFGPLAKTRILMPVGADIVAIRAQHGKLYIWAEVDPEVPTESRDFYAINTGDIVPCTYQTYRGTAVTQGGDTVVHVYESSLNTDTHELTIAPVVAVSAVEVDTPTAVSANVAVREWLERRSYDGMFCPDVPCGCLVADLMPCACDDLSGCYAGYRQDVSATTDCGCDGNGTDHWHVCASRDTQVGSE